MNLEITLKLSAILAGMALINIILGAVQGGTAGDWSWKKFFNGILKAIVLTACMAGFCVLLEYLPQVFAEAGIEIPDDLVTVVQVFAVLGATIKKYASDVFAKITEILNS